MATDADFIAHVMDQIGTQLPMRHQRMFGEYALYLDEKVVALACDNRLFLRPTAFAAAHFAELPMAAPYPGAKPHVVADALLDEPDRLRDLLRATAAELPPPKPRKPRKPRTDATSAKGPASRKR